MKKWITIACLLLIFCQARTLAAPKDDLKFKLLRQLSQVAEGDTTRLYILHELMQATRMQPEVKLYYTNSLLKEAVAQNNSKYKCLAYLSRLHVAYNAYDTEGVKRWAALLEPLARKEKFYDILFQCKRCTIDFLAFNEEYELEEKEALKMLKEAQELRSDIGIIVAYKCLANVYFLTYRFNDGIEYLEKAYDLAVSIDEYSLAIEMSDGLTDVYELLRDYPNWLKRIEILEKYIKETLRRHPEEKNSFDGNILMAYISRISYHTRMNEFALAERALQLAVAMNNGKFGVAYDVRFHKACYEFYQTSGNLEKALIEVDVLIGLYELSSPTSLNTWMCQKAYLLSRLERYDEALDLYKIVTVERDSLQLSVLNKQTDHIRQSYDADTLLLKKEQTNRYVQISSILLVGIIILLLIYFVIRAYRVRNHLRKSEKEMREMAQEMERMNQTKERFLSSISVGINDPLNAIVSGSLQLASVDEISNVQRKELSESINNTSAYLMKLINNILDLSRFESGMMKYSLCEIELISFIQSLARSLVSERPDLRLQLPAGKQIMIESDINKLTDLFMRLFSTDGVALSAPEELRLELTLSENEHEVSCSIFGTVLINNQTQDMVVMNEINRLFIEHFGGTYQIVKPEHEAPYVKFVLPVNHDK